MHCYLAPLTLQANECFHIISYENTIKAIKKIVLPFVSLTNIQLTCLFRLARYFSL